LANRGLHWKGRPERDTFLAPIFQVRNLFVPPKEVARPLSLSRSLSPSLSLEGSRTTVIRSGAFLHLTSEHVRTAIRLHALSQGRRLRAQHRTLPGPLPSECGTCETRLDSGLCPQIKVLENKFVMFSSLEIDSTFKKQRFAGTSMAGWVLNRGFKVKGRLVETPSQPPTA
jgi:hypothetical protein